MDVRPAANAINTPATPLTAGDVLRLGTERLAREGLESAALEMSLLLAEALGTTRLGLYMDLERPLAPRELDAARGFLARRIKREPIAYILKRRDFFGLTFEVSPAVLVPRPETELLVEATISWINESIETLPSPLLADIGTGSGAIAIAVAHACPASRWMATDISAAALEIAQRNAARHGVESRIEFRLGPLLEPIPKMLDGICANLPYIAEKDRATLAADVVNYEPAGALFSGDDGLDLIRELIAAAPERLRAGGWLRLECGAGQARMIAEIIKANGNYGEITILRDLAGIERVVQAVRS